MPRLAPRLQAIENRKGKSKPDTSRNLTSAEKAELLHSNIARVKAKLAEYEADKDARGIAKSKEILANLERDLKQQTH